MTTTYSKDCFSRFDDDLCELILSYLPVKSKFKLECVCHRWQIMIFTRVQRLCIYSTNQLTFNLFSFFGVKHRALEMFFKKCPNLSHIYLDPNSKLFLNIRLHLIYGLWNVNIPNLMLKYCKNLRSVDNSMFWLNKGKAEEILTVFGPQLKSMVCYSNIKNFDQIDCQQLKGLRHLNISYLDKIHVQLNCGDNSSDFPIKGLLSLKISCTKDEELTARRILCSNRDLEYLSITFYGLPCSTLEAVFNDLTKLCRLKQLLITLDSTELSTKVFDHLQGVGTLCRKLERLVIKETVGLDTCGPSFVISVLNTMKYFPNLVTFKLGKHSKESVYHPDIEESDLSIKHLKNCQKLQKLKLSLYGLRDSFFTDIDKYLPKLSYLSSNESDTTVALVDSLVRLKCLQRLAITKHLSFCDNRISSAKVNQLFANSARIKEIYLRYKSDIYKYNRGYYRDTSVVLSYPSHFTLKP